MEIPLQLLNPNPNFIHDLRIFSTLLALVIAAIAAFVTRSRRLIPKLLRGKSVIPHPSSISYSSSDDDDRDSCSDDDEEEEPTSEEEEEEEEGGEEEESRGQNRNFEWGFSDSVVRLWEPYVHAAAGKNGGHVAVGVWDSRSAAGEAASATWRTEREVVGVAGREEKVYVSDDVGRVKVVDLRSVRSTLGEIWLSALLPEAGSWIGK